MSATSITGKGLGLCGKATLKDLSLAANGPIIYFSGLVTAGNLATSPSSIGNNINFVYPLSGGSHNYVVILTTVNGGYAYINELNEDDNGDFSGFSFITEAECDLMYIVASRGTKPLSI